MSAILSPAPVAQPSMPWRSAFLVLAAVWLVLGLLYADTVATMVGIWYRSRPLPTPSSCRPFPLAHLALRGQSGSSAQPSIAL
jgi:hypothetical protein